MLLLWQGNFTESLKVVDITPISNKNDLFKKEPMDKLVH